MLDHTGFAVTDFEKSKDFYIKALAPLSIELLAEVAAEQTGDGAHAGFGADGRSFFWIGDGARAAGPVHVAFTAQSRANVDAFYVAGMEAGGRDNGGPGLRPHYHPSYYSAYVRDPDGNNIEAVCHGQE
jgi:catechol 2,3-dioxygenase-like lactoylglutathione lyase family enzyme